VRAQYRLPRGVTEIAELLRENLDAVVVLTPSSTHFDIVKPLLEAGLDVLVEKPATTTAAATVELAELAERRGRILMVAFNRRFAPLYGKARELYAQRRVSLCVAEKHRAAAVNPSLAAHFLEEDIHMIDLLRWFGGEGHAVSTLSRLRDGKLVDALSSVAFDSGGIGIVAASLEAGGWMERVTLHGDGLSVQVDAFRELRVLRGDVDEVAGRADAGAWTSSLHIRGFAQLIEHFVACVQTRQTPLTSAWEARKTQRLLEEMVAKELTG
jgi:virulence factor